MGIASTAIVLMALAGAGRADSPALEAKVRTGAAAVEGKLIAWRRDIHQHPELGDQETRTSRLVEGLKQAAREAGVPVWINSIGSCFSIFFTARRVTDYQTARLADTIRYSRFFHAMLARGIYLAPSQFETL